MLLVCNAPDVVADVLDNWKPEVDSLRGKRVETLIPRSPAMTWDALQKDSTYQSAQKTIADLMA
jgi:beta-N-acetylhexosaminidase